MAKKLQMISLFGLYYGAFAVLRNRLFFGSESLTQILKTFAYAILFFSVWFNVVTAPLWNRRADRLNAISKERK